MNPGIDLTAREAPHGRFVDVAAVGERRDECGSYSSKRCSHTTLRQALKSLRYTYPTYPTYLPSAIPSTSFIVNQPCLP